MITLKFGILYSSCTCSRQYPYPSYSHVRLFCLQPLPLPVYPKQLLEIMAGHKTMSGLTGDLTDQSAFHLASYVNWSLV